MICHVNGEGKFTVDIANVIGSDAAGALVGQEVLTNGSKAVVDLLKRNGSLVKVQRIKHRYPYDWKTNEPVLMTCVLDLSDVVACFHLHCSATSQWFADLSNIKDDALEALGEVSFYPAVCECVSFLLVILLHVGSVMQLVTVSSPLSVLVLNGAYPVSAFGGSLSLPFTISILTAQCSMSNP